MKRFTETQKWADPWYRRLPAPMKCFWQYILDNCDSSGVWKVDFELASFQIGEEISIEDVRMHFKGRVRFITSEKIFIIKFIKFQYGALSSECKPHRSVIQTLLEHGISLEDLETIQNDDEDGEDLKGYRYPLRNSAKGSDTLQEKEKEKETEKDKDQEKGKEGGLGGEEGLGGCPEDFKGLKLYSQLRGSPRRAAVEILWRSWPDMRAAFESAFPGLDLIGELRKAHAWEISNPGRRKSDLVSFLCAWFMRANERLAGSGRGAGTRQVKHEESEAVHDAEPIVMEFENSGGAEHEELFRRMMTYLRQNVPKDEFATWFSGSALVPGTNGILRVKVPSYFHRNWIQANYEGLIKRFFQEVPK